jgi:hypothetical protein
MALTKIGASLGGSADIITVTQTSHTFVSNDRGKAVRMNNNSGTPQYVLAIASGTATADAIGIIIHVTDGNNFTMATSGRITVDGCVPNEVAGTVLFLHTAATGGAAMGVTDSGHLTSTEPSGNNEVSKPMAVITIANSEMIMLQQRGEVISTAGISIADDAVTTAKIADDAVTSAKIAAGTIVGVDIADGVITAQKLASGSVGTSQLANNQVTGDKIALGSDAQGDVMYYNGTDWVRLGFGTSGHFLKTQGTGANPLWAAATTAAHGASDHTNITRTIFMPPGPVHTNGVYEPNRLALIKLPDNTMTTVNFTFQIPVDYSASVGANAIQLVWYTNTGTTNNMFGRFESYGDGEGASVEGTSQVGTEQTMAAGGNKLINVSTQAAYLTLNSIQVGDYIGVSYRRNGSSGSDTISDDVRCVGMLFTYTATQ